MLNTKSDSLKARKVFIFQYLSSYEQLKKFYRVGPVLANGIMDQDDNV